MLSALLIAEHELFALNAALFVACLLGCVLLSGAIKARGVYWLPESAAYMLFGSVLGMLATLTSEAETKLIQLPPNLLFFVLLPPIILDAGYTLKRKDFFQTIAPVVLLASVGTVVNNLVFGYAMFAFAKAGLIPLDGNDPLECLLFGAIISATDPVATLGLMGNPLIRTDKMLYSLVLGESVLNDAVAIVLYKAFEAAVDLTEADEHSPVSKAFSVGDLMVSLGTFVGVSIGSVIIGVGVGLGCSYLCKEVNLPSRGLSELSVISLFAALSYFLADACFLSPIMSLFFCAVILAHYNWYNLTTLAQRSSVEMFHTLASISETALYLLMGFALGLSIRGSFMVFDGTLVALTVVVALVARAANVFPLCSAANLARSADSRITAHMQIPLWFAGLRGGVSFALSMSFPGPHRALVMGATMMLAVFTIFVGGGLTLPLLRATGMTGNTESDMEEAVARLDEEAGQSAVEVEGSLEQQLRRQRAATMQEQEENEFAMTLRPGSPFPRVSVASPPISPQPTHGLTISAGGVRVRSGAVTSPHHASSNGYFARFRAFDRQYLRRWFGERHTLRTDESGEWITSTPKDSEPPSPALGAQLASAVQLAALTQANLATAITQLPSVDSSPGATSVPFTFGELEDDREQAHVHGPAQDEAKR